MCLTRAFKESLPHWQLALIGRRNSGRMWLLAGFHPAPPAQPPSSSLEMWIWLMVIAAIVVIGAMALTWRR
jgi:hypothetical protein